MLVACWDLLSRGLGREIAPGFMGDVLKSAQNDGALWLLVIAFCVAALNRGRRAESTRSRPTRGGRPRR